MSHTSRRCKSDDEDESGIFVVQGCCIDPRGLSRQHDALPPASDLECGHRLVMAGGTQALG